MTARRPLPTIAPCPKSTRAYVIETQSGRFRVFAPQSEWAGPIRYTRRNAILAWNRRASDAEAERRGAEKAAKWLDDVGYTTFGDLIRERIDRGEVLPAKGKKGKRA